MNVKNTTNTPITIGHTVLVPGAVVDIDETLLYQPRVQSLRASGALIFPFVADAPPAARSEPTVKALVLEIATEVKPESSVSLEAMKELALGIDDDSPKYRKRR